MIHIAHRRSCFSLVLIVATFATGCSGSGANTRDIPPRPSPPPIGAPSFSNCAESQERSLREHWRDAANAVFEAHDYMQLAPDPDWNQYKSFFDTGNSDSFKAVVRTCYSRMSTEFQSSAYTMECAPDMRFPDKLPCQRVPPNCPTCNPPDAFIANIPFTIFICPPYWNKISDDWRRSRYETQIHEMSHWSHTCQTKDFFLTWSEAQGKASEPAVATTSADNYAYFAESHPYPNCSAAPGRPVGKSAGIIGLLLALATLISRRRRAVMRRRLAF